MNSIVVLGHTNHGLHHKHIFVASSKLVCPRKILLFLSYEKHTAKHVLLRPIVKIEHQLFQFGLGQTIAYFFVEASYVSLFVFVYRSNN